MAEIVLAGITKRFGSLSAVADVSFTIADGEFMVLLGPTGAGKTTTLRWRRLGYVAPGDRDSSGIGALQPSDEAQRRGLSGARHLRLPAILSLPASVGLRQSRLPAAFADTAHP